jgi:ATP-binding cassette subfamily C protein
MIGGISRFRVAGAEKRAFFQWAKAFARQRKIEYRNEVIDNTLTTFNSIFPIIATMLIFIAAFYNRNLGTGSFIAFNSAFTGIMTAMVALSAVILSINTVITIYECMEPILQTKPEYDEWKEDPGELDGSIELSHITFRYQPDASAVINDLSLRINKGEYLAIVGPSGCGKSTILRLLLGFEKPEAGNIYYGGHDINKVDIRAIRKQLGVVMQNSQLMIGDIRSNVLGTNPNLTIEDAVEALKMAGIYQDIEAMPMGIFTVISEGGSTLSGGQRQRLLIARVLVNKPKIIFFDEATSALDNKTQAIVSKSLDALDATKVVIAHRLSTIINCDRILVIDKGCIIEEGKYEDLMKKEGTFYELAKRQLA